MGLCAADHQDQLLAFALIARVLYTILYMSESRPFLGHASLVRDITGLSKTPDHARPSHICIGTRKSQIGGSLLSRKPSQQIHQTPTWSANSISPKSNSNPVHASSIHYTPPFSISSINNTHLVPAWRSQGRLYRS